MLQGRRVLVVEDEYMLADELAQALSTAGAVVMGPAPSIERALFLVNSTDLIDAAVVDVNLRGEPVYKIVDRLLERGIVVIFASGYDQSRLGSPYNTLPFLEKPVDALAILEALCSALRIRNEHFSLAHYLPTKQDDGG